jgi:hypothetical protein
MRLPKDNLRDVQNNTSPAISETYSFGSHLPRVPIIGKAQRTFGAVGMESLGVGFAFLSLTF